MQEEIAILHLQSTGNYRAGLQLEEEVLQARIKALGAEHPQTARAKQIIGTLASAEQARNGNAAIEGVMKSAAEEILHESHSHLLRKASDPYGHGSYGCDICDESGFGWVYRCADCGFDAHPWCVGAVDKPALRPEP